MRGFDLTMDVTNQDDGGVTVLVGGDLNDTNCRSAAQRLRQLISAGPPFVRLDLEQMHNVDPSGVRALLVARYLAWEVGVAFSCTHPQTTVIERLRLAGVVQALGVEETSTQ